MNKTRGYSLLTVLLLLTLLAIAMGGLLFFISQSASTSGAMIERRRTFYACDGMSRQIMTLSQKFLERNTLEDVPEDDMEIELRAGLAPNVPAGFTVGPLDLEIPKKDLPTPVPVETITNGPFAGLQAKIQTIDIRLQATKNLTGAVCRTEQSISLGRIALFQFFVFADLPLLDIVPPTLGESLFMRGRIHTNGRVCLGGGTFSVADDNTAFSVRLDSRVTAVERILQASQGLCQLGGNGQAGIISFRAPGEQSAVPGQPDRLDDATLFDGLNAQEASGCPDGRPATCVGGWRSYATAHWLGRVQDIDHQVSQLTLPVDPPVRHVQVGLAANGGAVAQQMLIGSSRPNTRFLIEPELTNDPIGFARNKMARKAQLRIIDGVWYVKDPGPNNDPNVDGDDGLWPGIPIWSDHPGEFTTGKPNMTREGVEGGGSGVGRTGNGIEVGQSDIRNDLAARASTDARLEKADWTARAAIANVPPTPRRFSYYAFVDRFQADADSDRGGAHVLEPQGAGLQWGRTCAGGDCDIDPPAVVSYGAISPVQLTPEGASNQVYWQPGFRFTNKDFVGKKKNGKGRGDTGWCGSNSNSGIGDDVRNNQTASALPQPIRNVDEDGNVFFSDFPLAGSPLPSAGVSISRAAGSQAPLGLGAVCSNDNNEAKVRNRVRLALLEGTRTGFVDTNNQGDSRLRGAAQEKILPLNFDLHALQEALADRTPGELGSYFCNTCLWKKFDGSIFITNTWRGSMLGAPVFPDGEAFPPPDPQVDDAKQPRAANETRSTSGALPYPLCAAVSDESGTAHAQLVGHRFLDADEENPPSGFSVPYGDNSPPGLPSPFARDFLPPPPQPTSSTLLPPEEADTLNHQVENPSPSRVINGSFSIRDCGAYSLTAPGALATVRPTAVRVINARVINRNADLCGTNQNQRCMPELSDAGGVSLSAEGRLPNGLNLITNVPAYVVGDVNQTSEVNDVQTGVKATDWVPFMIAADTVTTLSNAWDDNNSRWGVATDDSDLESSFGVVRPASSTRYHMLLLTGINAAGAFTGTNGIVTLRESGGGLPNAMRLMEDWKARGTTHLFRGALVLGWNPVYTQWRVANVNTRSYLPPLKRDWQFDRHLNATINQPPDSPVFDVAAVRSWRRE
ncbi:MAG: hypothetical protein Q8O67_16555 [Deltaproteobacteria bacterium]|nr:hypothetical protein [Deltaproteobacteria bacterium]